MFRKIQKGLYIGTIISTFTKNLYIVPEIQVLKGVFLMSKIMNQNVKHNGCLIACTNMAAYSYLTTMEQIRLRQQGAYHVSIKKENLIKVRVTIHAFERWNSRVGGGRFHSNNELAMYLQVLLSTNVVRHVITENPRREKEKWLIEIDKDIVAAASFENDEIIFCSFFGRISRTPALANWHILRRFSTRNIRANKPSKKTADSINLDFSVEDLENEELPALPISQWHLQYNNKCVIVEKYLLKTQIEPVYLVFQRKIGIVLAKDIKGKKFECFFINTADRFKAHIDKEILFILSNDNQETFVTKYKESLTSSNKETSHNR